jgi:hypothetical protein
MRAGTDAELFAQSQCGAHGGRIAGMSAARNVRSAHMRQDRGIIADAFSAIAIENDWFHVITEHTEIHKRKEKRVVQKKSSCEIFNPSFLSSLV